MRIAERITKMKPSATLAVSAMAAKLRAQGVDVIAFGVGEPDFDTPEHILHATREAMARGVGKYTAVSGTIDLRTAIAKELNAVHGTQHKPENIIVSAGAKQCLYNLMQCFVEAGDQIVIPSPCWVSYPELVQMADGEAVLVETSAETGFALDTEKLCAAVNGKTRAILLNSPCNPTGAVYPAAALRELDAVMARYPNLFLITDDIYRKLVYGDAEWVSLPRLLPQYADRILLVDGVSKSYAMTGWRIGWAVAPKRIAKALDTIQGQSTTNATAVAQHAAVAALRGPQDAVREMRDKFQKRRDVMVAGLNALGLRCRKPEGAFYAFADCRSLYGIAHGETKLASDEDVAMFLLDAAHVASVPGGPFGAPGYVRFSYATNEERIGAGLASVRAAVEARR